MYSRYGNDANRPIRLPDHYSGSAFSQRPTDPVTVSKREPAKPLPRSGVEEKASPTADRLLHTDTSSEEIDALSTPATGTTDATKSSFATGTTDATNSAFTTNTTGTTKTAFTANSAGTTDAAGTTNTAVPTKTAFATDSAGTTNTTDFSVASGEGGEQERKTSVSLPQKLFGSSPLNFAGLRRLLGGGEGEEDHDRLLLLGLILLLSRTEGDSDILLWLSLLLLCG